MALYVGLRRKGIYQPGIGWAMFFLRQTCALLTMAIPLWYASSHLDWVSLQTSPWLRFLWLLGTLSVAGLTYLLTLWALGMRLKHFRRAPVATQTANLTK